jgi:ribosome-binding protein aMBF1 (putative translation factor)
MKYRKTNIIKKIICGMINPHFLHFIKRNSFEFKTENLKGNYEELQSKFGSHLKRLRESKGLSLRSLAAKCDLDDSQISKIENGKTNIQLSTIFELAKGLEIEPKDLIDFTI